MAVLKTSFISSKLIKRIKSLILVLGLVIFFTNLYVLKTWWTWTNMSKINSQASVNTIQSSVINQWTNMLKINSQASVNTILSTQSSVINHLRSASSDILRKNLTSRAIPTNLKAVTSFPASSLNGSCLQKMTEMQDGMLHFRNITIRPKLGRARVLQTKLEHPKEEDEYFALDKGFFTLYCDRDMDEAKKKLQKATTNNALQSWALAMEVANPSLPRLMGVSQTFQAGQYLAIKRIEYANVYWTVIDMLDIFITTQVLGIVPEKLNIVLMDAHPPTSLDPFWSVPFHKLIKLGNDSMFTNSTGVVFENLVWRYPRVNCPLLNKNLQSFKYIQPFREFVLQRFGIPSHAHIRNCSEHKIKVLVSFRRDYHSHPRNLDGTVDRKIANEKDVLKEMEESFPNITIAAAQLDTLPLKAQLELVSSADIFFGMHGSAHAFPIFMPPGGAVIEIFNFNSNNWHMWKIAALSGHSHFTWTVTDAKAYNKQTRSTTIPPGVTKELLSKAIQKICA